MVIYGSTTICGYQVFLVLEYGWYEIKDLIVRRLDMRLIGMRVGLIGIRVGCGLMDEGFELGFEFIDF